MYSWNEALNRVVRMHNNTCTVVTITKNAAIIFSANMSSCGSSKRKNSPFSGDCICLSRPNHSSKRQRMSTTSAAFPAPQHLPTLPWLLRTSNNHPSCYESDARPLHSGQQCDNVYHWCDKRWRVDARSSHHDQQHPLAFCQRLAGVSGFSHCSQHHPSAL